jgi:hypothetical protein
MEDRRERHRRRFVAQITDRAKNGGERVGSSESLQRRLVRAIFIPPAGRDGSRGVAALPPTAAEPPGQRPRLPPSSRSLSEPGVPP